MKVWLPSGEIGLYSGDVFPSGQIRTRGGSPKYYWKAGGQVIVPKDGIIGARLLNPQGQVVFDTLDPSFVQPGHKIEILTEIGEFWLYAGTVLEVLPPRQYDELDDWA